MLVSAWFGLLLQVDVELGMGGIREQAYNCLGARPPPSSGMIMTAVDGCCCFRLLVPPYDGVTDGESSPGEVRDG